MPNKETCDMKIKILKLIINHVEQIQQVTRGIYCESYEIVGGEVPAAAQPFHSRDMSSALQYS